MNLEIGNVKTKSPFTSHPPCLYVDACQNVHICSEVQYCNVGPIICTQHAYMYSFLIHTCLLFKHIRLKVEQIKNILLISKFRCTVCRYILDTTRCQIERKRGEGEGS